ncbi:MAG TPA: outer membrane beta-barrel protein [Vicinamibacterales bacterium]|jgi:outer membrane immunogenic protein|nr:outer membrane beta-barrel protein [Vicinamibacterales bacterium]
MITGTGWRITFAVVAALTIGAAPALAQSPAASVGSGVHDWTGLYGGLNAGYGWGNNPVVLSGDEAQVQNIGIALGILPSSLADDPDGFIGGAQLGYSFQLGPVVLGTETDLQFAEIASSQTVSTAVPPFAPFTTRASQKLDMLGTVRGRVGISPFSPSLLPDDALLFYATGGFAYGHASLKASAVNPGCFAICSFGQESHVLPGWTVGGGLEYAFARRWSVKAEYLHYDLGSFTMTVRDHRDRFPGVFETFTADISGNVVRLGVNFKFWGP